MLTREKESLSSFLQRTKSDPLFTKASNLLMRNGKRSKAEKVLLKALGVIDKEYPGESLRIFYLAVIGVKQDIAVRIKPKPKKKRKSQSTNSYNVYLPRVISASKGFGLGIRSLVKASRDRSESSLSPLWDSLSRELIEAARGRGAVVAKRYKVNELASSNKRRVHFGTRG